MWSKCSGKPLQYPATQLAATGIICAQRETSTDLSFPRCLLLSPFQNWLTALLRSFNLLNTFPSIALALPSSLAVFAFNSRGHQHQRNKMELNICLLHFISLHVFFLHSRRRRRCHVFILPFSHSVTLDTWAVWKRLCAARQPVLHQVCCVFCVDLTHLLSRYCY